MKKVLSFVLVLAMILGSFATAFALPVNPGTKVTADNTVLPFEDAEENGYATVLRDLGALIGDENAKANVKGTLTRAEAATIVVRLLGLDDLGKVPTATKFKDVAKEKWYSGYVAVAAAQGVIQGRGNGTFGPEDTISVDECVALLCQTLGYNAAHLAGSWPVNYRNVARTLKMLGTVTVGSQEATRGDFFQLVYNTLDQNKVVWTQEETGYYVGLANANPYETGINYFANETLFEAITGSTKKVAEVYPWGKVSGSAIVTLSAVVTAADKFANKFDASTFYGKSAFLLFKADKSGKDPAAIGIWKLDTTTLTGKFVAKRGYTDVFTSFVAEDGTEYKISGAAISTSTAINYVYRNGALEATTAALGVELTDKTTYTLSVTLNAKKDTIDSFESISYWWVDVVDVVDATAAALYAAEEFDIAELNDYLENDLGYEDIAFATTNASVTSTKKVYLDKSCVFEGAASSFAEVQEDDVVEIYGASSGAVRKIAKVVVTRDNVEGKISTFVKGKYYVLDGTKYTCDKVTSVSFNVDWTNSVDSTSTYALYLNAAGKVVAMKEVGATFVPEYQYAFVTGTQGGLTENSKYGVKYGKVWLVVPGQEEVVYDTLKCTTGESLAIDEFDAGTLVRFALKDGALATIAAVENLNEFVSESGENISVSANGVVAGTDVKGHKLTAKTLVYVITTDVALSDPDTYVLGTVDDLKDSVYSAGAFEYITASATTVKLVVISGGGVEQTGVTSVITFAAYVAKANNADTTKEDITFVTAEGKDVTYTVPAGTAANFTVSSFGSIQLRGGKYVGFTEAKDVTNATSTDLTGRATVEALKLKTVDGVKQVVVNKNLAYNVADDAPVMFLDNTAGSAARFVASTFADAIGDANADKVTLLDIDGDGEYDYIVVYANR